MGRFKPDLGMLCKLEGLPIPHAEVRFDVVRKWRFDWAWIGKGLAVEVDGGTRIQGRHSRHDGFERDCEKLNAAQLAGWRVLRFTTEMVEDGRAIETLRRAFGR